MAKGNEASVVKTPEQKKKTLIIVISAITAVLIIAGIVLGIVLYVNRTYEPFDYVGEDLDKYIYISDENYVGYKGYEVAIAMDEIDDKTVNTMINQILAANRGKAQDGGVGDKNAILAVGDDISVFFRAYKNGENGERVEIGAMSNFAVTKESSRIYTVGGGSLDTLGLNLELMLIGKDLREYSSCEIKPAGEAKISANDIAYVTYSALYDGQKSGSGTTVCVDLSDPEIDKKWGYGFTEFLVGKMIGENLGPTPLFESDEYSSILYRNITVERVMRFSDADPKPLEITTTVPCTYSDVSLQGVEVTFELYIDYAIKYDTPALDETFIKETLKMTDDELSKYDGESITDKFRAYVLDYLKAKEEAEVDSIRIEAMWSHLYNIAQIKELPKDEVERIYREYKKNIEDAYEANPGEYSSLDEYANAYVAYLGGTTVWTEYFRSEAEAEVKHKLIFYYIAKKEKLLPNEDEFNKLAKEIVEEEVESYLLSLGIDREDYKTDKEYEEAVAKYRAEVEARYSDKEYLTWVVHLEFCESKMSKFAKVVYKNPSEKSGK